MAVSTVTEVRTLPVIPETSPRDEFVNSEFYIDESLPSSLEWGRDGQVHLHVTYHHSYKTKFNIYFIKLI